MDELLLALRAAAEPTRLRLLALCAHMDLTVSQLVQILGQSQPRVSRHLKLLADSGMLDRLREGSRVFYRIARIGPAAGLAQTLVDALDHDDPQLARDLERLADVRRERAAAAAEYFNRNARRWNRIRKLYVDEDVVERTLLEILPEEPVEDILDIGTGTGRILEVVSSRARRITGIDLSHEMLNLARANIERNHLRNCRIQHADMYRLNLPDHSIDIVTIHQVLHFADDPAKVLAEAARVLRRDGLVAIVDFASHELERLRDEYQHVWLGFDDSEIGRWARQAGLGKSRTVRLPGSPLTTCLWLLRRRGKAPQADDASNRRTLQ